MRCLLNAFAALAVLSISCSALSQDSAPTHQHGPAKMIDGSVNPELIPDLTAYRLYLLAVSKPQNPTDSQKRHQAAQLGMIGIQEGDRQTILAVLANFRSQYESLIRTYNEIATAANARGESADPGPLERQIDQLTQSSHDELRGAMTAGGWARLDARVQSEKKNMKIGAGEEGR